MPSGSNDPDERNRHDRGPYVYEELAQHRGQVEASRDVLLAPWAKRA